MLTIDTTNMCSHLQRKLFEVATPKVIREDKLCEILQKGK